MTVFKVAKWLLFLAAGVIVVFGVMNFFGWSPFATQAGQINIASTGPRVTQLEPVDFACHVYGETRFIQTGLKEADTTRIGIGNIGINISHGDTLSAFLAVVGQFEHCAEAADQRVWHDGQTLFAEVKRIRLNRPALTFGDPTDQTVPSCSAVNSRKVEVTTDPAEFDRTHYLCAGGFTLDQGEVATFYQALQAFAEWNVARSECVDSSTELFKRSITDHYQRLANQLGLELEMVGLDSVSIAQAPESQPSAMSNASFTTANQTEVCN